MESHVEDEVVERGGSDFAESAALWPGVMENVGGQLATAGFCSERQLGEAADCYKSWAKTALVKQTLAMRGVTGRVP